jgi:hypothetical protein
MLAGCDSQVGNDYPGQSLIVLKGAVNYRGGVPSGNVAAALLWHALGSSMPDTLASATPVKIEKVFPAPFTITIYLPPPTDVLHQSSLPYAVASVGAINMSLPANQWVSGMLGLVADPLLYYFKTDVEANGIMGRQYGPMKRGYHLISRHQTVDPSTLSAMQIDDCANALQAESRAIARGDAQLECSQSLLTHASQEVPLDTNLLLEVSSP